MLKRPDYYLYRLLEALFGASAASAFIRVSSAKLLDIPRLRAVADSNFRRVHAFTRGRAPGAEETAAFRAEMAALIAAELLSTFALLRNPGRGPVPADPELIPAIEALRREGRGVVLATPHFGDCKMLFLGLGRAGLPLHVMINAVQPAMRAVTAAQPNLRFTDFSTGARYYLDALARNELVLLLTDMDYFPGGRTLDFFGAPCNPPHGPARLALAAGAPATRRSPPTERSRKVSRSPSCAPWKSSSAAIPSIGLSFTTPGTWRPAPGRPAGSCASCTCAGL